METIQLESDAKEDSFKE